ncbi:MAG: hypothetical protein A3F18_02650 [Legionellales bacterium RIFCSPHIGHO2_12_FULL_37_14]|nr:MAG: hypothetical protein A3F18_02650 [Legionellales bacterium RIFCSPHIGHO2_12_FULL_37_14]
MIGGKQKGVVVAGAIGNALEWYDFTIYAFFVPIIAKQFFPHKDPFLSLLATFGVFAVGFLVRPFGAVLFGYIGDHVGRKKALIISMIMMSFPTFLIGLLPNYQHIGLAAPILLVLLRIVQGLAVSGELTTATVFLIEHADVDKRGIAGSLAMSSALLGMVFSAVFATLTSQLLIDENLMLWGWRLPFLLGGLIGIMGLIVRLRSIDPSIYLNHKESSNKVNLWVHLRSLPVNTVVVGIFLTSVMACSNYFLVAFFNTFLVTTEGLALRPVMVINAVAITLQVILTVVMGRISDFVGRKLVLGLGMVSMACAIYPIFWMLTQKSLFFAFLGEITFACVASMLTGLIPTTLAEMFDTFNRNTGISVSYNLSLALFGGTAPLIALSLVAWSHNVFAPAWYMLTCATCAFFALLTISESYQKDFCVPGS